MDEQPTPAAVAFECFKDAWREPSCKSLCVGLGTWSIKQWVAYCMNCKPVPLNVFEGMVGEHQNRERWMPAFPPEMVERALAEMPDCEAKRMLAGSNV